MKFRESYPRSGFFLLDDASVDHHPGNFTNTTFYRFCCIFLEDYAKFFVVTTGIILPLFSSSRMRLSSALCFPALILIGGPFSD